MRLLRSLTRILGMTLLGIIAILPMSVHGHDPVPAWLTQATVPRLEFASGDPLCSAIVIRGAVVVSAEHCSQPNVFVNYGPAYGRGRVDRVQCSAYAEDFAILGTRVPVGVPMVDVWTGPPPDVGTMVWVAGYPAGQWTVRQLTISTLWFRVTVRDATPPRVLPLVLGVTHADVARGGISGGAMFTRWGRLLGVMVVVNPVLQSTGAVPIQYGLAHCAL